MNNEKKEIKDKNLSHIEKYFTIIDDDVFIDYLCFFSENEIICLTIDSSGENISIINVKEMNESIKRTGIKYKIEKVRNEIFLKEIDYIFNEYNQLEQIDFIFDSEVLKLTIGLDSLCYVFI